MNRLWWLYCGYVELHNGLVKWLTAYVCEDQAGKIARRALANLFRWACNAVETTQGPYADAAEQALAGLLVAGFDAGDNPGEWPLATLPALDDAAHYRIAHLYSLVYAMQYDAGWTVNEREQVFMWIMTTAPVDMEHDQLEAAMEGDSPIPAPVRRAVESAIAHKCDGQLICAVTEQIWRDEHKTSRMWMRAQMTREAIAPWPR